MQRDDYLAVEYYFEWYYINSVNLSERLKSHWGRTLKEKESSELQFHLDFGRTQKETNYEKQTCGVCSFG